MIFVKSINISRVISNDRFSIEIVDIVDLSNFILEEIEFLIYIVWMIV